MAGQSQFLLEGGMSQPTLTAQAAGMGRGITAAGPQPHHGVIGLVALAVLVLYLLDRFGFRFAVTAGKR